MTHCYLRAMSPIHLKCKLRIHMAFPIPVPYSRALHARSCQHGRAFVNVCGAYCREAQIVFFLRRLIDAIPLVDRRIWSLVGARCMSLVWAEWNASVLPGPSDAPTHE